MNDAFRWGGEGMAGIRYLCVFCKSEHEVAKRADGPVYLRCPTTYRWAWYDARAFDAARIARRSGKAAASAGGTAGARRRVRPASPAPRTRTSPRAKAAVKKGRAARPSARKSPRKRGRR